MSQRRFDNRYARGGTFRLPFKARDPMSVKAGIVYILSNRVHTRWCKIGYSSRIGGASARAFDYSTQHGMDGWVVHAEYKTELPIVVEAAVHARFAQRRVQLWSGGKEVFDIRPQEAEPVVLEEISRLSARLADQRQRESISTTPAVENSPDTPPAASGPKSVPPVEQPTGVQGPQVSGATTTAGRPPSTDLIPHIHKSSKPDRAWFVAIAVAGIIAAFLMYGQKQKSPEHRGAQEMVVLTPDATASSKVYPAPLPTTISPNPPGRSAAVSHTSLPNNPQSASAPTASEITQQNLAGSSPLPSVTPPPHTDRPDVAPTIVLPTTKLRPEGGANGMQLAIKPPTAQPEPTWSQRSPAPAIPQLSANAELDYTGHRWICKRGHYQVGSECSPVLIPTNATLDFTGHRWTCQSGYFQVGGGCTPVSIPTNAELDFTGHRWTCKRGYYQTGTECSLVAIPTDADLDYTGHRWTCKRGYYQAGSECSPVLIPTNATLDFTGHRWTCQRGYYQAGNACLPLGG
jgi:hypothetical protein